MKFKEMDFRNSYINQGSDSLVDAFLNPALKATKEYKRSAGFFSSDGLIPVMDGLMALARNGGHIKLIASPRLNEDDIQAIAEGYERRQEYITNAFTRDFVEEIDKLPELKLQFLCELIKSRVLDIKIVVLKDKEHTLGMYHDKMGILHDFEGDTVVFYGSANASYGGLKGNYERIRVARGWQEGFEDIVAEEEAEFDSLWNNTNPFLEAYDYTEIAEKNVIEVIERKKAAGAQSTGIKLRDYQEDAIKAWVDNGYHGFYVMATGTGKTWTAIYSAKALVEQHPAMIVICAPYKHLVKQWSEDVGKAFPDAKIIMVSSENPGWDNQIATAILHTRYSGEGQIIIISTISSFRMGRFGETVKKYKGEKLLIVDEAHRFTERPESLKKEYAYMLGLSATPFSGKSAAKGKELMEFFGGQVFSLPIEEALDRGFLVKYYYYPIFVEATYEEEEKFRKLGQTISSCFKGNVCIDPDRLVKALRARLRIISMAEAKMQKLKDIIRRDITDTDHFVVYCGDGKLFDPKTGDELRHINAVKIILSELDYKASQFTAKENMATRMALVDSFNKGQIDALAAIRCLDEGINIPSIKSALILSSNDDYREFVQRRGRILRLYEGKEFAKIYDVVVLPSGDTIPWAEIELRRFHEYAKLALNWDTLADTLNGLLDQYGLEITDVDVYDYEEMEDPADE